MFKKLSIISAVVLLSACSSAPESNSYSDNAVIQTNNQATYTQIIGKQIIPVDLLEHNLALQVSLLNVMANISNDSSAAIDSIVNFEIQYKQDKNEQQEVTSYDLVTVGEQQVALQSNSTSQNCDEQMCVVTQQLSFPVSTELLISGQQNGVQFLLQQTNSEQVLETMIPSRYLSALFSK